MTYTEKIGAEHLIAWSRTAIMIDVKALRTCKDCGLQALTFDDLTLFLSRKNLPYGRANWCKKCYAKYAKSRYPSQKMREAIDNLEHPSYCYFCGKEITKLSGLRGDCVTIHSLDGNHNNWSSDNKVPAHRSCHTAFHLNHRKPEIYKKVSQALTGITRSKETRAKMSAAKTPEIIQKLRIKMTGPKNPKWKGDKASDKTKYAREWRRKRREKHE